MLNPFDLGDKWNDFDIKLRNDKISVKKRKTKSLREMINFQIKNEILKSFLLLSKFGVKK